MRILISGLLLLALAGCHEDGSDDKQRRQNEVLLNEATSQVGMPAIKNFRERKLLKDVLEMRDQDGLVTYAYLENLTPQVVPGKTALGGKLTYFGETIGFAIPYATQFTNPQKIDYDAGSHFTIPQADPNGLFSPSSAEGSWILMKDPNGKDVKPVYVEPRIVVSPFRLTMD